MEGIDRDRTEGHLPDLPLNKGMDYGIGLDEIKLITISIETPDGKLPPAKVRIPNVPMRMADLVPPMQMLCEGVVTLAIQREKSRGETISCHQGCNNGVCCCQLVPLSPPEAFFLLDFVQTLSSEHRNRILDRFQGIKETMDKKGLTEKIKNIESTHEHQALAYEYFQMGMPCPFLEKGSCSIYPIRPFACREYNIVSPSEWCVDPFKKGIRKIKISRNMTTATARLAAKLCQMTPMLVPMTLSLEWAEENWEIGKKNWPGIWLFERMLEFATGAELESPNEKK